MNQQANQMKISIITVTYNSEAYLPSCINSVLEQTYSDIEYIIIDGASKDGTLNIINGYKDQINIVVSEPDRGIYDAMNKGINLATGEVIGILNSDDLFNDTHVVETIAEIFKKKPDIGATYGNIIYFRSEDPEKVIRVWNSKAYNKKFFENGNVPPHPSLFVKKDVYDKIGTYYPHFKISSDYEFMLRMMKLHKFPTVYIDKTIVRMRMGGASTKGLSNIILGNKEIIQSWKMNQLRLPKTFFVKKIFVKLMQLIKL